MSRSGRVFAGVVALALAASACRGGEPEPSPSPLPTGTVSAAQAAARLCERPAQPDAGQDGEEAEGATPPAFVEVMEEVQEARGLEFLRPVDIEAVTAEEMASRVRAFLEISYPERMYERRSLAWETIGVIPPGYDLREGYVSSGAGQVLGFYDPAGKELVFIGTEDPSPIERWTLAHELTHALDDQHFDLARLNVLEASCRDEELEAALGAVEGSAQLFSSIVAGDDLLEATWDIGEEELKDVLASGGEIASLPLPGFLQELSMWPYLHGQGFMAALRADGGLERVDEALRDLPASTEQVIHPERFQQDEPREVDVPDLAPALGEGWRDLDVYSVGEHWLSAALRLRLDQARGTEAAAGWDGGQYRAWTDGERATVVLFTAWDSSRDAAQFAGAMEEWLEGEDRSATDVLVAKEAVAVLWAPDDRLLDRLRRGLA